MPLSQDQTKGYDQAETIAESPVSSFCKCDGFDAVGILLEVRLADDSLDQRCTPRDPIQQICGSYPKF